MTFSALLNTTVIIFNQTDVSNAGRYGDEDLEWDDGTTVRARVSRLEQSRQSEDLTVGGTTGDLRITKYVCRMEAGVPITSLSYVEWQGQRFRVVGEPGRIQGFANEHHVTATLEVMEG